MDTPAQPFQRIDKLLTPPAQPVRLGIIGLGWAARNLHLPSIAFLRQQGWLIEIAALCDSREDRLRETARQFPVASPFGEAGELLSAGPLDGVLIFTHPNSSSHLLRQAIISGTTTFVEKPVAMAADEIDASADLARTKHVMVQVGYNRRYQPFYDDFRKAVEALPSPKHIAAQFWRATRAEPGFFLDTLVHPLELLVGTLGPLRATATKVWAPESDAALDYGWRVDLTSETDPGVTAEIDIRPSTGKHVESYNAIGYQRSCTLHFPYTTRAGALAAFEQVEHGERTMSLQAPIPAGDVAASCYYGGFVGQMAQFIRLCAGLPASPRCTLDDAATVLRIYEQIVAHETV